MHVFGAFELDVSPAPQTIRHVSGLPFCDMSTAKRRCITAIFSLEELEGQINSLQDELDEIRERARRAFQVT